MRLSGWFVKHSIMNGIDIMRIFDALNDLRNIEVAVDETLKCGAHAQGAIWLHPESDPQS